MTAAVATKPPPTKRHRVAVLGATACDGIESAAILVSAHANRVAVEHGHTICMSVALEERATAADVERAIADWRGAEAARGLPTSPDRPLILTDQTDQPQPRR